MNGTAMDWLETIIHRCDVLCKAIDYTLENNKIDWQKDIPEYEFQQLCSVLGHLDESLYSLKQHFYRDRGGNDLNELNKNKKENNNGTI
jgi:hypothetical protein